MAGVCVGPGLFGDADGIRVYGPRSQAWPSTGAGCSLDEANGIRTDPVTQKLWTPPDAKVLTAMDQDVSHDVIPTFMHDTTLTRLTIGFTGFACRKSLVMVQLTSGTAHIRLGDANYWAVTSVVDAKLNGVATTFGYGYWSPLQNRSGGVILVGLTTAAMNQSYVLNPNDHLTVAVEFTNHVYEFNADPANELVWQPPHLTLTAWSLPL